MAQAILGNVWNRWTGRPRFVARLRWRSPWAKGLKAGIEAIGAHEHPADNAFDAADHRRFPSSGLARFPEPQNGQCPGVHARTRDTRNGDGGP